jgi:hypothetical protein
MSTEDKPEGLDCKFVLKLEIGTNSSNSNLIVTKTVISVLFWLEVNELDDLLAVKRVWRRAASTFYITFYLLKYELYCIRRTTIRTVNRPKHATSTESSRALSFTDEWLRECVTTHPKCRHSFALRPPTWLTELRRDSGCHLYEFEENDPFPVYATLSHYCTSLEFPVVARSLFSRQFSLFRSSKQTDSPIPTLQQGEEPKCSNSRKIMWRLCTKISQPNARAKHSRILLKLSELSELVTFG